MSFADSYKTSPDFSCWNCVWRIHYKVWNLEAPLHCDTDSHLRRNKIINHTKPDEMRDFVSKTQENGDLNVYAAKIGSAAWAPCKNNLYK